MYFRTFRMFFIAASRLFFFSKSCKRFFRFEFPIFPYISHILFRVVDRSVRAFCSFGKKSTCQTQIFFRREFLPRPWAWHGICSLGSSGLKDGKTRLFPLTQQKWPPSKVPIWASHAKTRSDVKVWVFPDDGRFCKVSQEWETAETAVRRYEKVHENQDVGSVQEKYRIYLEPVCPLFWWLNPPKTGLLQSKQGSFGFQVYNIHDAMMVYQGAVSRWSLGGGTWVPEPNSFLDIGSRWSSTTDHHRQTVVLRKWMEIRLKSCWDGMSNVHLCHIKHYIIIKNV